MPAKIKLARFGKKGKPSFRIVVADESTKRQGKTVAILGYYNPSQKEKPLLIHKDKLQKWLSEGAVPTDAVRKLIEP